MTLKKEENPVLICLNIIPFNNITKKRERERSWREAKPPPKGSRFPNSVAAGCWERCGESGPYVVDVPHSTRFMEDRQLQQEREKQPGLSPPGGRVWHMFTPARELGFLGVPAGLLVFIRIGGL